MTTTLTPLQQQYVDVCHDGNRSDMLGDINQLSDKFMQARIDFSKWYDNKPEEIQALIDEISDRTYFIIDEDEYDEFIEHLAEYDINTAEDFESAFCGEFEGYGQHILNEFTENLIDEVYDIDSVPAIVRHAIDYELVYHQSIQYDYFDFQFKENTYIFNRNY